LVNQNNKFTEITPVNGGSYIVGPYYRGTSQGMGAFFDAFYEHPILMLLLVVAVIGIGVYFWRKSAN